MNEQQLDEFIKEAKKAKREDLELSDSMSRLLKNQDFQLYLTRVLGKRTEELGALLLEPSNSLDGVIKSEFMKGAMYAFCLARDMPSIIIKSMSEMKSTQENEE